MMVNPCSIFLESDTYCPGQTINGRVDCNFSSEDKVRGICIRCKGRAKVHWSVGKRHHRSDEIYFEMVSDLLTCETTFPPGKYSYPFTFDLPSFLPPTLEHPHGDIKYFAEAVIDRPWAIDYKDKRVVIVHSYKDLNDIDRLRNPFDVGKVTKPCSLFEESGEINFSVHLPVTGFVPLQMVAFTAKVKNDSNVNVKAVQFHLIQGFTFHSGDYSKTLKTYNGDGFEVINSSVAPGKENSWDLEIRLPAEAFTEYMGTCKIIKSYTELRGELILPIIHKNLKLKIPITVGSVPLA